MKNFVVTLLVFIFFLNDSFSQSIGIGTATPNASAMLDVQSANKGMLIPRIALTAANAASPVSSPADALLVYNTVQAGTGMNTVSPGFYYWSAAASRWTSINGAMTNSTVGFGSWGGCGTSAVSEYNPVVDDTGDLNDRFGYSVSISGNYAIAGAYLDDVGANTDQGSASIYQFNGTNWVFMQKLTDATGAFTDNFGWSVSISGNYAVVGSWTDDVGANTDQGSASIYQFNGTSWVLMLKITDATGAAGDRFGWSVSISGNYVAIGASNDNVGANNSQGSVSTYQYNGSSWVLMNKITDAFGAANDYFGSSVYIDGTYMIAGSPGDDVGSNNDQGSASIYWYNGSNWTIMQKFSDPGGAVSDQFGNSVSISNNYAIVGASRDDIGTDLDRGSACIYEFDGGSWVLTQKITDGNSNAGRLIGNSVSIAGNYAMVGTNYTQGSANIYMRMGLGWQRIQYLSDPVGAATDLFGAATALDGVTKRFVVGAFGYSGNTGKIVFGKIN